MIASHENKEYFDKISVSVSVPYWLSRCMRFSVLGEFFGDFAVLDDFFFGFAVSNTP